MRHKEVFPGIGGREASATRIRPTQEQQLLLIATDLAAHPTKSRIRKGFQS